MIQAAETLPNDCGAIEIADLHVPPQLSIVPPNTDSNDSIELHSQFEQAIYAPVTEPGLLTPEEVRLIANTGPDAALHLVTTTLLHCAGVEEAYRLRHNAETSRAQLLEIQESNLRSKAEKLSTRITNRQSGIANLEKSQPLSVSQNTRLVRKQVLQTKDSIELKQLLGHISTVDERATRALPLEPTYTAVLARVAPYDESFREQYMPSGAFSLSKIIDDIHDPTDNLVHPTLPLLAAIRKTSRGGQIYPAGAHLLRFVLLHTLVKYPEGLPK